jgi:hypothetical protein
LKGFDISIAAKGDGKESGNRLCIPWNLEPDVRKWVCREEESGCGLRVELGRRYYGYYRYSLVL